MRKLFFLPILLLLFVGLGSTSFLSTQALNGNTYSVPFSNKAPLLDAVFDDPEWQLASNTTYQINNPVAYRMTGYVADFSVALLGTPSGLYIAFTLTMTALDSNGMGFEDPGFYAQFDTDNDGAINETNLDISEDDDLLIIATNNNTFAGSMGSSWSSRDFEYAMVGDLVGRNLTRTLRAEVRYSYLQSGTTAKSVGVNFGIRYHVLGGYTFDRYSFMVDSGDQAYNTLQDSTLYTIGSFSLLTLNPGVAVDVYPPTINLLTPVMGTDGIYNLSVTVTDVNDIILVEFSEDGTLWSTVTTTDAIKYTMQWDSSSFSGDALFFRAMDNQSNVAVLTIDVTQSIPGGDYVFSAVVVDNSPPLLNLVSPNSGSTISGQVTIQVEALDNSGVVMVDWKIGDDVWNNMFYNTMNNLWEATWDTTAVADGNYSLSFMARDSINNTITTYSIVTVGSIVDGGITTTTEVSTEEVTVTETEVTTEVTTTIEVSTITVTAENGTESNSTAGTEIDPVPFSLPAMILSVGFLTVLVYRRRKL